MIIPQTRNPIQVLLQRGIGKIVEPELLSSSETQRLRDFNWVLKDSAGETFNLKQAKGKVIVLNFWATWCPPCIAEMSDFENLYQLYKNNRNIAFLFVSQEENHVVESFMQKNGYNLSYFQPASEFPEQFRISSIPRTFIIDKEGAIVMDMKGVADWDSVKMREILKNLIN